MASFIVRIGIVAGCEAEFETIINAIYEDTHAKEPGCKRYEYWRCQTPGHYYCLLSFDDFEAFLVHQTSDHHEKDAKRLLEIIDTFDLEWLDPVQLDGGLKPTVMASAPKDADALTKTYADMFAMSIAQWWSAMRKPARVRQ